MARLVLAIGIVGIAVAAALLLIVRSSPSAAPTVSTTPQSWSLPSLEGSGSVTLAQFRGRPLVVDFFASWCTSCQAELPDFLQVSQKLGGAVRFVGVDSEENGDGLGLARRTGITAWPLARDVDGTQQSGLRDSLESIRGMPITAFYDSQGHLLQVRLGALTGDALMTEISSLYGAAA
ncbi:MAG: redoxin domain-containing protein [Candidatus Dormibacteraeota bacterium]|nr:redoxin domain-containing protein [Candidatus Dormibacteraeota bacterium]